MERLKKGERWSDFNTEHFATVIRGTDEVIIKCPQCHHYMTLVFSVSRPEDNDFEVPLDCGICREEPGSHEEHECPTIVIEGQSR